MGTLAKSEILEPRGFEPLTSSMPLRRSPKLSYSPDRAHNRIRAHARAARNPLTAASAGTKRLLPFMPIVVPFFSRFDTVRR